MATLPSLDKEGQQQPSAAVGVVRNPVGSPNRSAGTTSATAPDGPLAQHSPVRLRRGFSEEEHSHRWAQRSVDWKIGLNPSCEGQASQGVDVGRAFRKTRATTVAPAGIPLLEGIFRSVYAK